MLKGFLAKIRHQTGAFAVLIAMLVVLGAIVLASPSAYALDNYGSDMDVHFGAFLPNDIDGVTDTLPEWGLRYATAISIASIEGEFNNANAKGVSYNNLGLSLRKEVMSLPNFTNLFYGGLDLNIYRPANKSGRNFTGGFHLGTGLTMKLVSNFAVRGDLKFSISPGTSLTVNLGLVLNL